ncbi:MAG: translation elongation factor-like protein [Minisyncoccia bacterium]|jgi:translation elongation factor EF-1alpha
MAKKEATKAAKAPKEKTPTPIGEVTHFYNKIGVAIVKFNKAVPVGTKLAFKGATTDFEETVDSMQYDHKPIDSAPKGEQVGIKVKESVREGDLVYPVE